MGEVFIFDHPLMKHKLTLLREKDTGAKEFRELANELSMLMAYEVTRDMPVKDIEIETPLTTTKSPVITGKKMGIIPILRAGLGMLDGILQLLPTARVGHVGLYRDPDTLEAVEYYCKLPPDNEERDLIVIDPMLATGGTASAALRLIKERGVRNLKFMCLVAAPEGIEKVREEHEDVDIFTAAVDDHLNDHAYIVPGLGDAGDRLYGTK